MIEAMSLGPAFIAGGLLGLIFFGGLWWTVRKGISSNRPALWFFGSLLLRMSITLGGFYLVAGNRWERMAACLAGFVISRIAATRLTPREASHAP